MFSSDVPRPVRSSAASAQPGRATAMNNTQLNAAAVAADTISQIRPGPVMTASRSKSLLLRL